MKDNILFDTLKDLLWPKHKLTFRTEGTNLMIQLEDDKGFLASTLPTDDSHYNEDRVTACIKYMHNELIEGRYHIQYKPKTISGEVKVVEIEGKKCLVREECKKVINMKNRKVLNINPLSSSQLKELEKLLSEGWNVISATSYLVQKDEVRHEALFTGGIIYILEQVLIA